MCNIQTYGRQTFSNSQDPTIPPERVVDEPPFSNTGLDFARPLHVMQLSLSDGTVLEIVYIAPFTCTSTRAVQLELVENLSVPTFFPAFRQFTSRRGLPSIIFTNNVKTFKSASREVTNIFNATKILRYFVNQGVEWKYVIEKAP